MNPRQALRIIRLRRAADIMLQNMASACGNADLQNKCNESRIAFAIAACKSIEDVVHESTYKSQYWKIKSIANCGIGPNGFELGNDCAAGSDQGSSARSKRVAHHLVGHYSSDVKEEIEDSLTDEKDLKDALIKGEDHPDWDIANELSDKAKDELKGGGKKVSKFNQEVSFGKGQKLKLFNSSYDGSEDFAGKFFAFDESVSSQYAVDSDYGYLREVDVEVPFEKLADESKLTAVAEQVLGSKPDYIFEAADNPKVQEAMRDAGYVAVKFTDVTPNNAETHQTVLFLEEPE